MSFDHTEVIRRNILALEPYTCARDSYKTGLLLDANENTYGAPVEVRIAIGGAAAVDGGAVPTERMELERYPDPHQLALKTLYGNWRGVAPENIFVGVGSDEAIDLVIRCTCEPGADGDRIITMPPTYGMYKVSAAINSACIDAVPLTPAFAIDVAAVLAAVTPRTKLIFVCTPNNPTANDALKASVVALLEGFTQGLVVVDEAYADFSDEPSWCGAVGTFPNLLVLQTFSKSWGLAGVRCGVAVGAPQVVACLNNMKAPYNLSRPTSAIVRAALAPAGLATMLARVATIKAQRERVRAALVAFDFVGVVHPSAANFVLFEVLGGEARATKVYRAMAEELAVVIRNRSNLSNCDGCLRATIGTAEENDAMLAALATAASKYPL
jgi:histidinol-phosphate aminotransferase